MPRRPKVSVIGAGNIGGECARAIAMKGLADAVLLDIPDKLGTAKGKALDIACCAPIERFDATLIGSSDYADIAGSDLVIVTAGLPRKPGMSRDDLVEVNSKIVRSVSENIAIYAPQAVVILVSNPLDAMVYVAWKVTGFPTSRIVGQAGALDVARFRAFLAMEIGCSVEDITALLLGGHGDDMVPLPRFTAVHGIPVEALLSKEKIHACVERAKVGGGEIVKLMGTSAWYAPSAGTVQMAEAILRDKKRIIPCAAYCENEYGVAPGQPGKGLFVGVPCVLGERGVERVIEIPLDPAERALMDESVSHVRDLISVVNRLMPDLP